MSTIAMALEYVCLMSAKTLSADFIITGWAESIGRALKYFKQLNHLIHTIHITKINLRLELSKLTLTNWCNIKTKKLTTKCKYQQ